MYIESLLTAYIINLKKCSCIFMSPQIIWKVKEQLMSTFFMCKFITYFQIFFVYFSMLILLTIARDRYYCICRPLKSINWNYKKGLKNVSIAAIFAFFISIPQLSVFTVGNIYLVKIIFCRIDQ